MPLVLSWVSMCCCFSCAPCKTTESCQRSARCSVYICIAGLVQVCLCRSSGPVRDDPEKGASGWKPHRTHLARCKSKAGTKIASQCWRTALLEASTVESHRLWISSRGSVYAFHLAGVACFQAPLTFRMFQSSGRLQKHIWEYCDSCLLFTLRRLNALYCFAGTLWQGVPQHILMGMWILIHLSEAALSAIRTVLASQTSQKSIAMLLMLCVSGM